MIGEHGSGVREIITPRAPSPGGAYSQGIIVNGFVFSAGCGPQDPITGLVIGDTIVAQTRQVLSNIAAILAEANSTLSEVVKVTAHLANPERDFLEYDAVCRAIFSKPYPVRTTVGSCLVGMLVEIDVVAVVRP